MSVRVLGATGKMFEAAWVVPTVETRFMFNGRTERRFEIAKSLDEKPNGLLFFRKVEDLDWAWITTKNQIEYIGNISTAVVREALTFMLAEGFYNFSEWDYQKEEDINKIVLDNGMGRPYSSAITRGALSNFLEVPGTSVNSETGWEFCGGPANPLRCPNRSSLYSDEELDKDLLEEYVYEDTEEDGWGDWDSEE